MNAETKEIFKLLKIIKSQVKYIKQHMIKRDMIILKEGRIFIKKEVQSL